MINHVDSMLDWFGIEVDAETILRVAGIAQRRLPISSLTLELLPTELGPLTCYVDPELPSGVLVEHILELDVE